MASPLSLAGISAASIGAPSFLGVIVATTTKNNADTATPFNATGEALKDKVLLIQPDAICYIYVGAANTQTATTANGIKLAADQSVTIHMGNNGYLACVSASGTTNCRVWSLT